MKRLPPLNTSDELLRIGPPGQRERGQIQSRRPALGMQYQLRDGLAGQLHAFHR